VTVSFLEMISCFTGYSAPLFYINNKLSKQMKKGIIKTICDSVNYTSFPKEDHLPH
jgi:hypothetical protein